MITRSVATLFGLLMALASSVSQALTLDSLPVPLDCDWPLADRRLDTSSGFSRTQQKTLVYLAAVMEETQRRDLTRTLGAIGIGEYTLFGIDPAKASAVLFEDNGTQYLVFRGTKAVREWTVQLVPRPMISFPEAGRGARALAGPVELYREMRAELLAHIDHGKPLVISGHSLGGTLAVLAASDIGRQGSVDITVYSSAQERSGNAAFQDNLAKRVSHYYRLEYANDIVPQVPVTPQGLDAFRAHVGSPFLASAWVKIFVIDSKTAYNRGDVYPVTGYQGISLDAADEAGRERDTWAHIGSLWPRGATMITALRQLMKNQKVHQPARYLCGMVEGDKPAAQ
jgi:triacylglycerol lipase